MTFVNTRFENPIMSSALFLYKYPLSSCLILLAPLFIFSGFLGFGFSSVLIASAVVIVSSLIFRFTKQKPHFVDKLEETPRSGYGQSLPQTLDTVAQSTESESITGGEAQDNEEQTESGSESDAEKKEEEEEEFVGRNIHGCLVRSPVTLSENDCQYRTSTSEDSEVDWIFQDKLDWSDDGSISDEDSLIEIALPSGQYLGENNKVPKFDHKMPDFTAEEESMLRQQCLMELLAEFNDMNEEDNLIEIDISMGSIKCSRFEIEA
ncbi:hypothetical protein HS088_TW10G00365 [Tripterygium wilfordii]|uniref:Transmembrane protein n=1 Tax=Tripterygium wilfordii TaxID=458696 RepID=A0A7J7D515_TRIWF|nr:uncharacterized protein LOC120007173 [Tripterygium wilfordii]KAF5741368.1 hypothetical protein HS088_TW10G00365 [Tripterygium wilfordii]